MSTNPRLSERQRLLLAGIRAGYSTIRALGSASGITSTSVVSAELQRLEAAGHIVLERTPHGERVYDGRDFCQAWDLAAKLAGNPEA